ncbi:MAG: DEAD/DEAH box helicase [Longimicrobiales bacterium]
MGVTATSHKVIVNLLNSVCAAAESEGVVVRVPVALGDGANLAAGTVWLWARPEMAGSVDVLFVDEAGQISLANVLAASRAADSIVLLGDPQQLEQPQKGVHPPGTDAAALEHLVGGATLSADRGLFLEETWRLHPDVCAFTSELFYEGRLTSRLELANQTVNGPAPFDGAGLRFVPVEHTGNSSESAEEVEVVRALIDELLASHATWVDSAGVQHPLRLSDVLVVAPYNAQVAALRAALPEGARVGTVDKFQGQEAPIVIYSTATSSAQDAPRGMEFLFSPNRLNVATSRARCLAVLVGSPELLGPNCGSVRQMRLANGVCRFGEMAGG